jgi:hypothetical protein
VPAFRIIIHRVQEVNGDLHRHLHLLSFHGGVWVIRGVIVLHSDEWERLRLICEVVSIEIKDESPTPISSDPPEAPTSL